jgi:hypothetical protein
VANHPQGSAVRAEERLLKHLGKTRAFLFAIGQSVDNPHGSNVLKRWSAADQRIGTTPTAINPYEDLAWWIEQERAQELFGAAGVYFAYDPFSRC